MLSIIEIMKPWQKTTIAMIYDFVFVALSFYMALVFRFESFIIPGFTLGAFFQILFALCVTQSFVLYFMGLYRGIWRYSSTPDLLRLIKGVSLAVIASIIVLFFLTRMENIPRSAFILDWLLLIVTLGGGRLAYRMLRDRITYHQNASSSARVLIVGAGSSGDQLFREIRTNPEINLSVVGFMDDDPFKRKKIMHGVPVLGTIQDLPNFVNKENVSKVFIAIPGLSGQDIRKIIKSCDGLNIDFKTLPKLSDVLDGRISFSQLRKVGPEDLLGRKEVNLDIDSLHEMITDKLIMVTGAGGSIGSELCRQISKLSPKSICLFEQSEFNLFELERELSTQFPEITFLPFIGDIRDKERVEAAFNDFNPEIVFHAAAYKHVPMMENNAIEAVSTNILGTYNLVQVAKTAKTKKFVMISTDKAVNPTNVMGASKRAAELVVQQVQQDSENETQFMTVRFGNVLGSSGSVIPIFQKQIEAGGPVTVTHNDIRRYFMTIPEASQLVLQAGALGNGGEIFVLDMGEPVKIIDLAKELISLSGLTLDKDIQIEVTGLRPGEKLYEEIFFDGEGVLPTHHPLVRIAKAQKPPTTLEKKLGFMFQLSKSTKTDVVKQLLGEIVEEYSPYTSKEQSNSSIH